MIKCAPSRFRPHRRHASRLRLNQRPASRRHLRRRPTARLPLCAALLCAIFLLCAAAQLCPAALADPFPLGEDLSETVTVFYNGEEVLGGGTIIG